MASLKDIIPGGFNAANVPPSESRDFGLIPNGAYSAEITGADLKENSKKTGYVLNVEFSIFEPEQYNKRKVWQAINVTNSASAQAQEIGQSQLSALCLAVGIAGELDDTDKLLGHNVKLRVGVDPAKNGYEAKNKVTGVEALGSSSPAVSKPAPTASAKKPWQK